MNQPLQVRWDGTIKNSGVPKCIKANEKHFIHLRKMKEKKNLKKKKENYGKMFNLRCPVLKCQ
jgi:hypothetical protein